MEQEFRVQSPTPNSPAFGKLMVDALRRKREEHPMLDMAAGNLPFVGGIQSAMDVADPNASTMDKSMALGSMVPGGKLVGAIVKRLRGMGPEAAMVTKMAEDEPFSPEEVFQKPDVVMSPEAREAARKKANEEYAEQLQREEAEFEASNNPRRRGPPPKPMDEMSVRRRQVLIDKLREKSRKGAITWKDRYGAAKEQISPTEILGISDEEAKRLQDVYFDHQYSGGRAPTAEELKRFNLLADLEYNPFEPEPGTELAEQMDEFWSSLLTPKDE